MDEPTKKMRLTTGQKIKVLSERNGLKAYEVANAAFTSPQNFNRKIKNKTLTEYELEKIAEAFNCEVDIVFTDKSTKEFI